MSIETWNSDERCFIKCLIEFYYILTLEIISEWIVIKFSLKSVFEEGKSMNNINKIN